VEIKESARMLTSKDVERLLRAMPKEMLADALGIKQREAVSHE
jgi:hypothetical protein